MPIGVIRTVPPKATNIEWNALVRYGIINTGSAFTGSSIAGQMFFRTDSGSIYWYDGSDWRTTVVRADGDFDVHKHLIVHSSGSEVSNYTDYLWHFDGSGSGATWDAQTYILPTGSKGLIRWEDDSGDWVDLMFTRSDMDPASPIIYTSQSFAVKKDLSAGGFVGANQGAIYLGSGLTHIDDQPQLIAMHAGNGDYTKYGPLRKDVIEMNVLDNETGSASIRCNCISGSSTIITGTVSGSLIRGSNISGSGHLEVAGFLSGSNIWIHDLKFFTISNHSTFV